MARSRIVLGSVSPEASVDLMVSLSNHEVVARRDQYSGGTAAIGTSPE